MASEGAPTSGAGKDKGSKCDDWGKEGVRNTLDEKGLQKMSEGVLGEWERALGARRSFDEDEEFRHSRSPAKTRLGEKSGFLLAVPMTYGNLD